MAKRTMVRECSGENINTNSDMANNLSLCFSKILTLLIRLIISLPIMMKNTAVNTMNTNGAIKFFSDVCFSAILI